MGCPPTRGDADQGDGARFLLVSDLHFFDDTVDADAVAARVADYVAEYECDAVLNAGDTGTEDDLSGFQVGAPYTRTVIGNHDELAVRADGGDMELAHKLCWEEQRYTFGMVHDPRDVALRATQSDFVHDVDLPYDVVIHGHSHMPWSRVLADGTLAIGAGSTYRNINVSDALPRRSVHVVDVDDTVTVSHVDYDSGEVVEEQRFHQTADGFEEVYTDRAWSGDRFTV